MRRETTATVFRYKMQEVSGPKRQGCLIGPPHGLLRVWAGDYLQLMEAHELDSICCVGEPRRCRRRISTCHHARALFKHSVRPSSGRMAHEEL